MDRIDTAYYWQERYNRGDIPWDIGYPSPPLMHYAGQFPTTTRILLPGAGRSHEAIALHRLGYEQVWVCDWAAAPLEYVREQAPDFPAAHLLQQDFFQLEGVFELILEQTFFSALPPRRRPAYAEKMNDLLHPNGRLAGVLFAQPFPHEGPPYGGTAEGYRRLFEGRFNIHQLQLSPHSIAPRRGNELFIELSPRQGS